MACLNLHEFITTGYLLLAPCHISREPLRRPETIQQSTDMTSTSESTKIATGIDHVETSSTKLKGELDHATNVPVGHIPETAEEKSRNRKLNRKMDVFLLPFLSLLYLFSGLDRSNVGNAETQGMKSTSWLSDRY